MRKSNQILLLLPLLALYLLSPVPVNACSCGEFFTPPCASYGRAEAVFIGTLTKVERTGFRGLAHFNVEKTFKGTPFKEREIAFVLGSCAEAFDFLKSGGKYLIYARTRGWTGSGYLEMSPCDRSCPLSNATEDLEYLEKAIQKKALPSIAGMLTGLTEEDLKLVKISITGDQVHINSPIEIKKGSYPGYYSVEVPRPGTYHVKFLIPFEATARPGELDYTVSIVENQCDYREIPIARDTKADK